MMKLENMKFNKFFAWAFVLVFLASCADLDITNLNEPNSAQVLASADDVANLPGGAFVAWHNAVSTVNTGVAWSGNADVLSCAWGNFGIRNMSNQPPLPIDNSLTSNDAAAIANAYIFLYRANAIAIDVERYVLENSPVILADQSDATDLLLATSLFLEGAAHGHVSILYNQGFLADASVDLGGFGSDSYVPASEVRDFAVAKLEEAAAIADASTFTLPVNYINGVALSSTDFAKLCRTVAAYVLVLHPRTPADVASTDWAKVLQLTNGGIDFDFAPIGDDNDWFDDNKLLSGGALVNGTIAVTWARLDNKIINLMDPSYPKEYPDTGTIGMATTADNRINTDMGYNATNFFPENRGRYRFGEYYHNRYAVSATAWNGVEMPWILQAENDLMRAEALIRTGGSKTTAATLINNTRVTRGGLAALAGTETDQVMLDAVKYEKMIELIATWGGRELAEARRWPGWLRDGAFTQLPVPGSELTLLGVDIYTFGGVEAN